MDRSTKIKLISVTYTVDAIGQRVPTETETEIFCSVSSIGYGEFHMASQSGIKPEYVVRVLKDEYSGQKIASLDGVRYSIYRTYVAKGETVELYLEKKAGV